MLLLSIIHYPLSTQHVSAGIKIVAALYIFILAGIVALADIRETQFLFRFIQQLPFGDKIGHFTLMGMFSLVVNLALSARTIRIWKLNYLLGSSVVLLIVTIEEVSQIYVRGRTFDAGDLLADAAGILIFGESSRFIARQRS